MEEVVRVDPSRLEKLLREVKELGDTHKQRHKGNYRTHAVLIALGVIGSISVSAAGLLGYALPAGLLGLMVALCIGLQNAFAFGERAEFQRIVAIEADNLRSRLELDVKGLTEFDRVLAEFLVLRTSAARNIPRGKGMDAVREMATELEVARK